jgi:phospholipid/cholesterol/gamma-HCH transport system permease protein
MQFHVDWSAFASSIEGMISLGDVWGGLIKGTVFGAIIGLIACASGLRVSGGAEAVGRATTDTVRTAIVAILVSDLLLTRLLLATGVTL